MRRLEDVVVVALQRDGPSHGVFLSRCCVAVTPARYDPKKCTFLNQKSVLLWLVATTTVTYRAKDVVPG